MATLKSHGLNDEQALGVYRGEFLGGFSSVKAAEMTPEERRKALDSIKGISSDKLTALVSPFIAQDDGL